MSRRGIRCKECGERFYTTDASKTVCQNCDDSFDERVNADKDVKTIREVNKAAKTEKPQAINPRTGLGAEQKAPFPTKPNPEDTTSKPEPVIPKESKKA